MPKKKTTKTVEVKEEVVGAKEEEKEAGAKEEEDIERMVEKFEKLSTGEKKFKEYLRLKARVEELLQPLNLSVADIYNLHQRLVYGEKVEARKRMEKALANGAKEDREL